MNQTVNPLRQYFRRPSIFLKLPSGGEHWPDNCLNPTQNGELPVFPMTAIDEITYRTPDALFNGEAVVSVIQSCVPNIINAWEMPATDLNAVLVAIRIASYGHNMEVTAKCPACSTEGEYSMDLRTVLDQLQAPDYSHGITHGDLEFLFRPISYRSQHLANIRQFEEQKTIQMIPVSDLPDDEKIQRLNAALKRITELTVTAIKHNLAGIRTPNAIVTEPEFIEEFLKNSDRKLFERVRDHVIALRASSEFRPLKLTCENCGHQHEQPLTLDMASFFGVAS